MSRCAIFLVMAWLAQASAPVWAQDVAPSVPPRPGEGRSLDEGRTLDPERPPPVKSPAHVSGGRVPAELLGVAFGAVPALLATEVVVDAERCDPVVSGDCAIAHLVGLVGGGLYGASALLATVGVYVGGNLLHGKGRFAWTLVSCILGTTGGVIVGNAIWQNEGYEILGIGVFYAIQATSTILGYELSSDDDHAVHAQASAGWTPTFALMRGKGGLVGARGTF